MKLVTAVLIMIASFSFFEAKAQSITYSNVLEIGYAEKGELKEEVNPNGLKLFRLGNCIWLQRFDEKIILLFSVTKTEKTEHGDVLSGFLNLSDTDHISKSFSKQNDDSISMIFILNNTEEKSLFIRAELKETEYIIK